jgi:hypothetical protein
MAIQSLKIWHKKLLSLDADVSLATGNKFRAGMDTYKDLQSIVGVGSVPCTNAATAINIDKGTVARAAIIIDMKYSLKTEFTMVQWMSSASTANTRVYANNKPWT